MKLINWGFFVIFFKEVWFLSFWRKNLSLGIKGNYEQIFRTHLCKILWSDQICLFLDIFEAFEEKVAEHNVQEHPRVKVLKAIGNLVAKTACGEDGR